VKVSFLARDRERTVPSPFLTYTKMVVMKGKTKKNSRSRSRAKNEIFTVLDNKNIDYSIDLNNFELDIFFKEEIQKVTVDYIKALEKYRKDYVELEEIDHLGFFTVYY
jgi:hypothetical protein